jgi:metal-responsive CopG/Arc/MetJ family transcriptional regulator
MVKKRQEPERVAIPMPAELIQRIDEYRWANRIPSRAEAIASSSGTASKPEPLRNGPAC